MTQELLSNIHGVHRENVAEADGHLAKADVVRYWRGQITMVDRARFSDLPASAMRRRSGVPYLAIKAWTESALQQIRPVLKQAFLRGVRPYNLSRWFLDMSLKEQSFDASTFSKNRNQRGDAVVRELRALESVLG